MGRWSTPRSVTAGLLPLLPGVMVATGHLGGWWALAALACSVLGAVLLAGPVAGAGAALLAWCAYNLRPHQGGGGHLSGTWLDVTAFTLVSAVVVLLVGRYQRALAAKAATDRYNGALAGQVAMLAPVLDTSPIGFVVFDAELRYTYVNRMIADIHQRRVEDYLGRTLPEVFPDSGLDHVPAAIRQVLETGEPQVGIDQPTRVGDEIKQLLINRYPVRGQGGEVLGVAVTYVDVTDRWRLVALEAEAAQLRATAELAYKYEAAQQIAGIGCWEVDLATGVRTWSDQMNEMLGITPEDLERAPLGAFTHPDEWEGVYAAYRRLAEHGESYRMPVRMVRSDGQVIHTIATGQLVRDEGGRPARLWGTVQDVTGQLTMERQHREAMHQAEQARADLAAERAVLHQVQRALLPATVPSPPGVELAVAYQPVQDVVEVGGDWYDAFALPDGRIAVAVGDVAGHDLRAATVMGQVRNALRAYAMEDPRPGLVLRRANNLMLALQDSELVTAVFGVYDPVTSELTLARAGHPQPLVRLGGRTRVLTEPRGIVLGAMLLDQPHAETRVVLGAGDAVLFYTDGLVERRGADTVLATERLCALVDAVPESADADAIVDTVTRNMIDTVRIEDDVCLLVLHRPARPTPAAARRRRTLARRSAVAQTSPTR